MAERWTPPPSVELKDVRVVGGEGDGLVVGAVEFLFFSKKKKMV